MGQPPRKIRTVDAKDMSIERMINGGGEKRHRFVIDADGKLKWWLGMAWITIRDATDEDRQRWPSVRRAK